MRVLAIVFLFVAFVQSMSAQVAVVEEPMVDLLVQRHEQVNRTTVGMEGWRVQILATTDRSRVMQVKSEFLQKYPRLSVQWDYSAPYYKLKVGAFLTKLEATALRHKIRANYPDAYVMKDYKIKPREF